MTPSPKVTTRDERDRSSANVALLICDLQNDFIHGGGAYGRAGLQAPDIAALPRRIKPLADALRGRGGWIVSTHFTLDTAKGKVLIAPHLKKMRPFLAEGDFRAGAWGHRLVDELAPSDLSVDKIAYSAFYMTRLEWLLRKCGIERLLVCGIVTNGGVASTVRDAAIREFDTVVLEDGCGAFSQSLHDGEIAVMRTLCRVMTVADAMSEL